MRADISECYVCMFFVVGEIVRMVSGRGMITFVHNGKECIHNRITEYPSTGLRAILFLLYCKMEFL